MLEFRKLNRANAAAQWELIASLPEDEIVPEDEIYLRVLKSNIASFKVICKNGGYISDEDDTHYLMRIHKYENH